MVALSSAGSRVPFDETASLPTLMAIAFECSAELVVRPHFAHFSDTELNDELDKALEDELEDELDEEPEDEPEDELDEELDEGAADDELEEDDDDAALSSALDACKLPVAEARIETVPINANVELSIFITPLNDDGFLCVCCISFAIG